MIRVITRIRVILVPPNRFFTAKSGDNFQAKTTNLPKYQIFTI